MRAKAYSTFGNIVWFLGYTWKNYRSVIFYMPFMALFRVCINLTELFIAPAILNQVENNAELSRLLLTIGVFTLLMFALRFLRAYLVDYSEMSMEYPSLLIRRDVIWKANTTSWPNTIERDIITKRGNAINVTKGNYSDATLQVFILLRNMLCDAAGFIIYLCMLTGLDPWLALVSLVTGVAGYFATRRADSWRYEHREEEGQFNAREAYIQSKAQSIELAKDVRIYGLKNWITEIHVGILNAFEDFIGKAKFKQLAVDIISTILTVARNGVAYLILINKALDGQLTAAEFVLYFAAVSGFTTWITDIFGGFASLNRSGLQLGHLREYFDITEHFKFGEGTEVPQADGYELTLENVSYRYPGSDDYSLRNVDLTIHAGEKLAIVGLNGAGKTTLVRLLCGLIDPTEGRVLLNGNDIRDFDRRSYYKLFSAVFQEFAPMELTVAEIVAQVLPEEIDRSRVENCIAQAGLSERIAALPDGLDSHIGKQVWDDGVMLSGGEMQRLMLARALYKDGQILILDEPTAALDPIAENAIYMKYNEISANKTSVFISHRLASTRFCDRIIFVADNGIAEQGTHDTLLAMNGRYAELFEIQSRYYREGGEF